MKLLVCNTFNGLMETESLQEIAFDPPVYIHYIRVLSNKKKPHPSLPFRATTYPEKISLKFYAKFASDTLSHFSLLTSFSGSTDFNYEENQSETFKLKGTEKPIASIMLRGSFQRLSICMYGELSDLIYSGSSEAELLLMEKILKEGRENDNYTSSTLQLCKITDIDKNKLSHAIKKAFNWGLGFHSFDLSDISDTDPSLLQAIPIDIHDLLSLIQYINSRTAEENWDAPIIQAISHNLFQYCVQCLENSIELKNENVSTVQQIAHYLSLQTETAQGEASWAVDYLIARLIAALHRQEDFIYSLAFLRYVLPLFHQNDKVNFMARFCKMGGLHLLSLLLVNTAGLGKDEAGAIQNQQMRYMDIDTENSRAISENQSIKKEPEENEKSEINSSEDKDAVINRTEQDRSVIHNVEEAEYAQHQLEGTRNSDSLYKDQHSQVQKDFNFITNSKDSNEDAGINRNDGSAPVQCFSFSSSIAILEVLTVAMSIPVSTIYFTTTEYCQFSNTDGVNLFKESCEKLGLDISAEISRQTPYQIIMRCFVTDPTTEESGETFIKPENVQEDGEEMKEVIEKTNGLDGLKRETKRRRISDVNGVLEGGDDTKTFFHPTVLRLVKIINYFVSLNYALQLFDESFKLLEAERAMEQYRANTVPTSAFYDCLKKLQLIVPLLDPKIHFGSLFSNELEILFTLENIGHPSSSNARKEEAKGISVHHDISSEDTAVEEENGGIDDMDSGLVDIDGSLLDSIEANPTNEEIEENRLFDHNVENVASVNDNNEVEVSVEGLKSTNSNIPVQNPSENILPAASSSNFSAPSLLRSTASQVLYLQEYQLFTNVCKLLDIVFGRSKSNEEAVLLFSTFSEFMFALLSLPEGVVYMMSDPSSLATALKYFTNSDQDINTIQFSVNYSVENCVESPELMNTSVLASCLHSYLNTVIDIYRLLFTNTTIGENLLTIKNLYDRFEGSTVGSEAVSKMIFGFGAEEKIIHIISQMLDELGKDEQSDVIPSVGLKPFTSSSFDQLVTHADIYKGLVIVTGAVQGERAGEEQTEDVFLPVAMLHSPLGLWLSLPLFKSSPPLLRSLSLLSDWLSCFVEYYNGNTSSLISDIQLKSRKYHQNQKMILDGENETNMSSNNLKSPLICGLQIIKTLIKNDPTIITKLLLEDIITVLTDILKETVTLFSSLSVANVLLDYQTLHQLTRHIPLCIHIIRSVSMNIHSRGLEFKPSSLIKVLMQLQIVLWNPAFNDNEEMVMWERRVMGTHIAKIVICTPPFLRSSLSSLFQLLADHPDNYLPMLLLLNNIMKYYPAKEIFVNILTEKGDEIMNKLLLSSSKTIYEQTFQLIHNALSLNNVNVMVVLLKPLIQIITQFESDRAAGLSNGDSGLLARTMSGLFCLCRSALARSVLSSLGCAGLVASILLSDPPPAIYLLGISVARDICQSTISKDNVVGSIGWKRGPKDEDIDDQTTKQQPQKHELCMIVDALLTILAAKDSGFKLSITALHSLTIFAQSVEQSECLVNQLKSIQSKNNDNPFALHLRNLCGARVTKGMLISSLCFMSCIITTITTGPSPSKSHDLAFLLHHSIHSKLAANKDNSNATENQDQSSVESKYTESIDASAVEGSMKYLVQKLGEKYESLTKPGTKQQIKGSLLIIFNAVMKASKLVLCLLNMSQQTDDMDTLSDYEHFEQIRKENNYNDFSYQSLLPNYFVDYLDQNNPVNHLIPTEFDNSVPLSSVTIEALKDLNKPTALPTVTINAPSTTSRPINTLGNKPNRGKGKRFSAPIGSQSRPLSKHVDEFS